MLASNLVAPNPLAVQHLDPSGGDVRRGHHAAVRERRGGFQPAQTGSIATSTGPLTIGGDPVWSSQYFAGLIDDVRIYNRALSAAEILTDMETPLQPSTFLPGDYNSDGTVDAADYTVWRRPSRHLHDPAERRDARHGHDSRLRHLEGKLRRNFGGTGTGGSRWCFGR